MGFVSTLRARVFSLRSELLLQSSKPDTRAPAESPRPENDKVEFDLSSLQESLTGVAAWDEIAGNAIAKEVRARI
jgi:hypothetical protein